MLEVVVAVGPLEGRARELDALPARRGLERPQARRASLSADAVTGDDGDAGGGAADEAAAELDDHHCIVIRERDQDFGRWTLRGPHGVETVKVAGPLSANKGEIVRQWAIDGHGIILRSLWDVAADIGSGRLVRVLPGYAQEADVWAVYPSRLSSSAWVRVGVEFLEEWFDGAGMSEG